MSFVVSSKRKRLYPIGESHPNWKDEEAGYVAKHTKIRKILGKATECVHCKRTDRKKYEWANKDHKYSRNIEDYISLCCSCHRKYDYENNNMRKGGGVFKSCCKRGHIFSKENTYTTPDGRRICRKCNSLRFKKYYAKRRIKTLRDG